MSFCLKYLSFVSHRVHLPYFNEREVQGSKILGPDHMADERASIKMQVSGALGCFGSAFSCLEDFLGLLLRPYNL